MPYFYKNKQQQTIASRYFQFPEEISLKHVAIAMCSNAQSRLNCFGKYYVEEDNEERISVEFSGAGADELFNTIRDWCKSIEIIDINNVDMDVAECIGKKIENGHLCCYQWKNEDDDEIQTSAVIYGDNPSMFLEKFESFVEKYSNEWDKNKNFIKTVSHNIASILVRLTEEKIEDENTFIYSIPLNESEDAMAKYNSNVVIFGEKQDMYLKEYNKLLSKFLFHDTPVVLAKILMSKISRQNQMRFNEVIFIPNGRQTFIYPRSDDKEKNIRFYKEFYELRSKCINLEVKTTLSDDKDLMTLCREVKLNNVFHFISKGKVFLNGLREDVNSFKKEFEKKLRKAEEIAKQAHSHQSS